MARVTTVKRSDKSPGKCGKCGIKIKKGEGYRWWKFRFGGGTKRVRCMAMACAPRQSDLTSSDKLSRAYEAGEMIEDALDVFRTDRDLEALKSSMNDAAEQLREVAGEYRESADNMESGMNGNRVPMCDELEEKAEALEAHADEVDSASSNLEEEGVDWDSSKVEEWVDDVVGEVEPLASVEVG